MKFAMGVMQTDSGGIMPAEKKLIMKGMSNSKKNKIKNFSMIF